MDLNIDGLSKLFAKLDGLVNTEKVKKGVQKSCALVEGKVKTTAPKDTGALRRSMTSKVEKSSTEIIGTVYTNLEYSPYIEYGTGLFAENGNGRKDVPWKYKDNNGKWHTTKGMKPQPFLRPALNNSRIEIKKIIKEELTK